jgi:hypothetical protein
MIKWEFVDEKTPKDRPIIGFQRLGGDHYLIVEWKYGGWEDSDGFDHKISHWSELEPPQWWPADETGAIKR